MSLSIASSRRRWRVDNERVLVGAGLLVIYVVWGSVYVAIRFVVEDVPALLSIGVRYVVAGALLMAYVAARRGLGALRVDRSAALACLGIALLLQVFTNGTVTFAESIGVGAGAAALLSALAPIAIVGLRATTNDRPRRISVLGIGVGFAGLAVLLVGGRSVPGFPLLPSVLVAASALCWAAGSFLQPRLNLPRGTAIATSYQLLGGGLMLTLGGLVSGEHATLDLPVTTWVVLAYLTVATVVTYSTYVWLLAHAPISLVSTHAYVNPVVAVTLGWLCLGESVTWPVACGGIVVLVAVGMVMAERRPKADEPPPC